MIITSSPAPQNQLTSPVMSKRDALQMRASPFSFVPGIGGSNGLLAPVLIAAAAATVVFGLFATATREPLLMTMLAVLAMLGLFLVFGAASGIIGLADRTEGQRFADRVIDGLASGLVLSTEDGRVLHENARAQALLGRTAGSIYGTLEAAFSSDTLGREAVFRLVRAATRGEPQTEDITVHAPVAHIPAGRVLRFTVQPMPGSLAGPMAGPMAESQRLERQTLWTIVDATDERRRISDATARLAEALGTYHAMPVAVIASSGDGTIVDANATARNWLGIARDALRDRRLTIGDIASRDAVKLITAVGRDLAGAPTGPARPLDIDLMRDDGQIFPARVLVQVDPAKPDGGLVLAILDRRSFVNTAGSGHAHFFHASPFGIATVSPNGRVIAANSAFQRMTLTPGGPAGEHAVAALCQFASDEQRAHAEAALAKVLAGLSAAAPVEITCGRDRDQTLRVYFNAVPGEAGGGAAAIYVIDATEQKGLEEKFAQSQKMEAVGKLAGGIAHDFNNVLTAIIGFSDLLLQTHRPTDAAYKDIVNIKSSANRAAALVSNLLGFSRQQTQQVALLNLGEAASDLTPILKTSVGEKIELKFQTERDLWYVKADRAQIDNVIINLSVNARDAMPDGGKLTIRTRNVPERESKKVDQTGFVPGEYVLIEVEDSGTGMTPAVMAKIFEPFFTTKGIGKGTGLGLASVYGIVKQTGGFIFPESEIGRGTTFKVYLPRHAADDALDAKASAALHGKAGGRLDIKTETKAEPKAADLTGIGRVLLVEDEDVVRSFAVRALKRQGYQVLEASDGVEALAVMDAEDGRVDIVVSDVVMPEMDGPTLLKELRKRNPSLKIIFMSGYPNDAFRQTLGEDVAFGFLSKPFSLPQLAEKVKEELAR